MSRILQTLRWWRDCVEHYGLWGWHRDLWLRSITAERAIDAEVDALLHHLKAARTLTPASLARVHRAERRIGQLRAQR